MTSVYRLSEDKRQIALVQKATLTTEEFGIEPTHGLFGSTEWWSNIASGFLAVHCVRGVIERVFMGSMNDWPMCTVVEEMGNDPIGRERCLTRRLIASIAPALKLKLIMSTRVHG